LRQCLAFRDRVGDFQFGVESAVSLVRIDRPADAGARLLSLIAAEPLGHYFGNYIGERPETWNEQNDVGPGLGPTSPCRVDDKRNIDRQQQKRQDWHDGPLFDTREQLPASRRTSLRLTSSYCRGGQKSGGRHRPRSFVHLDGSGGPAQVLRESLEQ